MEAQHLIVGAWNEGDRIRRQYRVAAKATLLAERGGWPPIARPLRRDPLEVPAAAGDASKDRPAMPTAASAYLERFDTALRLSEPTRSDVRNEIRDHIEDSSAALSRLDHDPESAAGQAVAGLGPPDDLAAGICQAQLTTPRTLRAFVGAFSVALFGATMGLAFALTAILLSPLLARFIIGILAGFGFHLYLPDSIEWESQKIAAAGWVAAFLAARRSTVEIAEDSRLAEAAVRPIWALVGAVPLLLAAVLVPAGLDLLASIALLGIPAAFVLGTWRYQRRGDDLVSRKGLAQAIPLLVVFLFAPGFRLWYLQPSSPVPSPAPVAASGARITWSSDSSSYVTAEGVDTSHWRDVRIDFWPAERDGIQIRPDPRAGSPALVLTPGEAFGADSVPSTSADWWLVLTAIGDDGARHTLATAVLAGNEDIRLRNLLDWLQSTL
jgi:hypothetical protein